MDYKIIENKMSSTLSHFTKEINGLRTGRASAGLVENIQIYTCADIIFPVLTPSRPESK